MGLRAQIDPEKLRSQLAADIETGQEATQRAQESLGAPDSGSRERVRIKGIRVGGQIIGQKEIAKAQRTFSRLTDDLIRQSGLTNQQEIQQKRLELQKKFNQVQTMALEAGLRLNQSIAGAGLAQDERFNLLRSLSGAASGIGQGLSYLGSGQPTGQQLQTGNAGGTATPMKATSRPAQTIAPPGSF